MKLARTWVCAMASGILAAGCPSSGGGGPQTVETSVVFNEGLSTFEVMAGVPEVRSGRVMFETRGGSLRTATLELNPEAIEVSPADGAKDAVRMQGGVLTVTVRIAPLEEEPSVCETGEEYGPFEVTLNEANQPMSVAPDSVDLSEATVALLEEGEFSICIEVVSPIDATVTVASFQFTLEF